MNNKAFGTDYLPTILMVRDSERKIEFNSHILSAFNVVYSSKLQNTPILTWIQQNQPDLIIVEYNSFPEPYSNLITLLKLDWLTRNIPIVVAGNKFTLRSIENLDYDACLNSPYSVADLNKVICSLIQIPICNVFAS